MKYLAIGYWLNRDTCETFSLSREVETLDREKVCKFLCEVAKLPEKSLDTVLVIQSTMELVDDVNRNNETVKSPQPDLPEVVEFWHEEFGGEEEENG